MTGPPDGEIKPAACLNCGTPLQGGYCHVCGQQDFDFKQSFWHTILEALEHLVHLDGRFARSMVSLLFLPGRLTSEFLAGRRASQIPPLRFYLFVSLVFFVSLPLRSPLELRRQEPPPAAAAAGENDLEATAPSEDDASEIWLEIVQGLRDGSSDSENDPQTRAIARRLENRFSDPQKLID